MSNDTEKKRINNVRKGVKFTLDYVASLGDSEPNFSSLDFSDIKRKGLITNFFSSIKSRK